MSGKKCKGAAHFWIKNSVAKFKYQEIAKKEEERDCEKKTEVDQRRDSFD
jgi:hypothetical protein